MDKVTRQCPQTTTFLKRKESRSGIEPRSFSLPAQRLTARPNRLTGMKLTLNVPLKREGARLLRVQLVLEDAALKEVRQVNVGDEDGGSAHCHIRQLLVDKGHVIQVGQVRGVACINDVYNPMPWKAATTTTKLMMNVSVLG